MYYLILPVITCVLCYLRLQYLESPPPSSDED